MSPARPTHTHTPPFVGPLAFACLQRLWQFQLHRLRSVCAHPIGARGIESKLRGRGKLGHQHLETLKFVNNLAALLEARRCPEAAEQLYREALEGRRGARW